MKPPRKLHIKSYGCQMNVYDAQRMVDTLAPEGFVETSSVDDADLVILNTCHIREKASEKVYSELGRLRVVKDEAARNGRHMSIAVAGCVAQAEGEEIIRRAPAVDVVVGPQSYHHLPQLLARARSHGRALETEFPVQDKFGFLAPPSADAIRDAKLGDLPAMIRPGDLVIVNDAATLPASPSSFMTAKVAPSRSFATPTSSPCMRWAKPEQRRSSRWISWRVATSKAACKINRSQLAPRPNWSARSPTRSRTPCARSLTVDS